MEGTLDFDCFNLGGSYTNSLNICKTLRRYLFRHAKDNSMVNSTL